MNSHETKVLITYSKYQVKVITFDIVAKSEKLLLFWDFMLIRLQAMPYHALVEQFLLDEVDIYKRASHFLSMSPIL